ncbi:MAG: cytochrome c biogenesis protein ResB [Planctomycetes bacterium]|nr:cytochrome c biogenesis protein ResB [Planctomycetota bacterium]
MKLLKWCYDALSSLWLSCILLFDLGILTWLGTLEQVNTGLFEVQKKYFESWFFIHHAGPIAIPMPGATLVLAVLAVNIVLGGLVRMRKSKATLGVLITHIGIIFLIFAGYVKMNHSADGHVTLFEGQASNTFESYHHWEIAILEQLDDGRLRETIAPQGDFELSLGATPVKLKSNDLPFELEIAHFSPNARVLPKGPMITPKLPVVDGYFLDAIELEKQNEQNIAGAYATVVERSGGARQEAILWGASRQPWTVTVAGKQYGIELRREQFLMPFTVALDDFKKEDHPRMNMPKSFSSDVTVVEGPTKRPVKISMNEPLRQDGLVLYQASWGPSNARPGDPLFSTLAVVDNPADQYPLYACIVIAVGLVMHFTRKLAKHIKSQQSNAS